MFLVNFVPLIRPLKFRAGFSTTQPDGKRKVQTPTLRGTRCISYEVSDNAYVSSVRPDVVARSQPLCQPFSIHRLDRRHSGGLLPLGLAPQTQRAAGYAVFVRMFTTAVCQRIPNSCRCDDASNKLFRGGRGGHGLGVWLNRVFREVC